MKEIRYLLSINELLDESPETAQLAEQAYAKLDAERKRKLDGMKPGRKYAECLGAGLLLQLGLQRSRVEVESSSGSSEAKSNEDVAGLTFKSSVQCLKVSEVVAQLGAPIEPKYTYGEKGKPYFQNFPVFFSLSHSGDYVFCAFSEREVGADIQYRKPFPNERVVRRFFTLEERKAWESCATNEEREKLFYRLWTRKEAYGKLTGEGIAATVSANVLSLKASWEDYDLPDDYYISVCKSPAEKE